MRIFKFLLTGLLVLLLLLIGAFFSVREILMMVAVAQLKSSLAVLRQIEKNPRAYALQCRQKGVQLETGVIERLQLRFLDSATYDLEVVCAQFSLDPIILDQKQLPYFVRKLPGSTGIIFDNDLSAVAIEIWGRRRVVGVEDREVFERRWQPEAELGQGPIATCLAYGFSCCDLDTQIGQGDQFNGVSDCPKSCFQQCLTRPTVLSFTSDPFMDPKKREIHLSRGQEVTFNYLAQAHTQDGQIEVILDAGDGQVYRSQEARGRFVHQYQCRQNDSCVFQAKLQLKNSLGIKSADLAIGQIKVIVK